MNILTPAVPPPLRITHTMWEDFLCDPVMAATIIFGAEGVPAFVQGIAKKPAPDMDAFQCARLRYYWWVPQVMDSSGASSGKTIIDWRFMNLRAILVPDQELAAYYPTHNTGKETFWRYYEKCPGKIFRSQMGELNQEGEKKSGKETTESGGTWKAHFLNGNILYLPAPSFQKEATSQASKRFNTVLVEEWTHIDAMSDAIDSQLTMRCTRDSWNPNHPIWGNHFLLTAPAKTQMHPGYTRFKQYHREVKAGNPAYATLHYSYKDFSRLDRGDGKTFERTFGLAARAAAEKKQKKSDKAEYLSEVLGIWAVNGKGWFTEEALLQCTANGKARGALPVLNRKQFVAECLQN